MDQISTKFIGSHALPLVIEPRDKAISQQEFWDLLRERKEFFKENIHKYGGLLFRDFPINRVEDFEQLILNLGLGQFIDYIGGDSPRNKVHGSIYTSTEAPPSLKIPLHNELSYVKKYPKQIYFWCDVAPVKDGETILADARKIYQEINPEIRQRFSEKGLHYRSCYFSKSPVVQFISKGAHKPWKYVFETEDKKEVEEKCRQNEFGFKWGKNDWLELSQIRPATMAHPVTGEDLWFNQAHLFDFNAKFLGVARYLGTKLFYCRKHMKLHEIFYADGTKIPKKDMYHIMNVLDSNTVAIPWQKGDVMVLDNALAMHGRNAFTGKRRILTAMTG